MLSEAQYKAKHGKGFKIFTSKKMLQKLPIALAPVKASSVSANLLNEIRQIFCIKQKKLPNNVYNNIMNLIKI